MSTVQEQTIDKLSQSNGQTDVSSANSIANLTINQPIVGALTTATTNYAPIAPTNLPYPAVNPYTSFNPLVYPPTGLPPIPTALPSTLSPLATTAAPYYAYQYPYAPFNYYQQPTVAPVLPITTAAVNQKADKKGDDKSKSKNKNKKAKNQQEDVEDEEDDDPTIDAGKKVKASNVLPFWGNEKTMNLNQLILTNVQNSPYFKNDLYQLKTYHEVVDEIYYQVKHLEPWERGSRKVGGQTGLSSSVRGVGAGGIVSTPFCILYKLYTLKLTRKQLNGLLKHKDSPYIRALGFMYIRFTQPPNHFWKWFEPYLEDEEEFEVKAGVTMSIGELCRHMMTKLDWFSTLFPRMPIPVQKDLENQLRDYDRKMKKAKTAHLEDGELDEEYDSRKSSRDHKYISSSSRRSRSRSRSRDKHSRSRSRDKHSRSRSRDKYSRDDRYSREKKDRDDKHRRSRSRERRRSKERSHRDRSKEKYRYR